MAPSSSVSAKALQGFPTLTGTVLEGRYRVGPVIGVGGMGAVFEAEHIRLGRKVAIKVMRPAYMQYRHHVARFLQEARAASQIKHPNVVEILDVGETPDGTVYTVMELLDGQDLASMLRQRNRLPWTQAHAILVQVVKALGAAHEHGVIHRDVKPANCILTWDDNHQIVVKMVDFGIAKFQDGPDNDDEPLTKTGEVIGTPAYMAPELALGREANAVTDVYSVGVLTYQMMTGKRPFGGGTAVEMHLNQTTKAPPSPRTLEPSIPRGVEALILRMVAVEPDRRPSDMDRLLRDLQALAPRMRNTLPMASNLSRRPPTDPVRPLTPPEPVNAITIVDGPRPMDEGEDEPTLSQPITDPTGQRSSLEHRLVEAATHVDFDERTTKVDSGPIEVTPTQKSGRRLQTIMADPEMSRRSSVLARPGEPQEDGKTTQPLGSGSEASISADRASDWPEAGAGWSGPASDSGVPIARAMTPSGTQLMTPPGTAVTRPSGSEPIVVGPSGTVPSGSVRQVTGRNPATRSGGSPWPLLAVVGVLLALIIGASVYWWPDIWAMLQGPSR